MAEIILLGIESSAQTASAAVCRINEGEKTILACGSVNVPVTHSETLMPLAESLLSAARLSLRDIGGFAVSNGPGSFTGLRIAVSLVKGLALGLDKPVFEVSTLRALAENLVGTNFSAEEGRFIACPVMDARREQVYSALFRVGEGGVERFIPDRAIGIDELREELVQFRNSPVVLVGDGAELVSAKLNLPNVSKAPPLLIAQNAVSVCFAADLENPKDAYEIAPEYIRLPQAERELLEKEKK